MIMDKKFEKNIKTLEENGVRLCTTPVWENEPNSVELETYTNAGEDMIIHLEEPSKKELLDYVDGFDIDEQVMLWWQNGKDAAHDKGVPFSNIREHYEDYEAYLDELRRIANLLD